MHCLCCLSLLSLCCLSLLSLDLGLCHGFLLSLRPCVGLPSDLLHRGGLLLGPVVFCSAMENVCSALVGSSPVCSTLVGSSSVRSTLVGSSSICSARSALVGSRSVRPTLVGSSSVVSTLASCSADFASIHSHSTSTWTWPSVPPPVPPPLHRHPGLYRSVWKPLLGGGRLLGSPPPRSGLEAAPWGGVCHESCPCTSVHSPPEVTHSPH